MNTEHAEGVPGRTGTLGKRRCWFLHLENLKKVQPDIKRDMKNYLELVDDGGDTAVVHHACAGVDSGCQPNLKKLN